MESIQKFFRDETGVTAAEYGIILGCITAALVLALVAFYTGLSNIFNAWADWFSSKHPPA